MSDIGEKCAKEEKEINDKIFPIKSGESVKERLKLTDKLVYGYNQMCPIERALGFKGAYEVQSAIHGVHHLIHAGDVETVTRWLLKNGYDIIKL